MTKPSRKAKWGRAGIILFVICAADFYTGPRSDDIGTILLLLGVLIGALLFIDYGTTG